MGSDAPWSEKGKMESEGPIMQVQPQDAVNQYDVDYEKHGAGRESNPLPDLKRKLKSRHLQMIAIGKFVASESASELAAEFSANSCLPHVQVVLLALVFSSVAVRPLLMQAPSAL